MKNIELIGSRYFSTVEERLLSFYSNAKALHEPIGST
jgi:hypothetical protein